MLFAGFHELAAARGDGLLPELRALLESRAHAGLANVTELAIHRGDGLVQAGPHPVAAVAGELPSGVVSFRKPPVPPAQEVARKTSNQR